MMSPLFVPRAEDHFENGAAAFAGPASGLTPVCAGDLPDEGKPEAEALPGFRAIGRPVERLEDPLPLVFGNTRPAVENQEPRP